MNKEQRKFKKGSKARKRSVSKKKILEQEKYARRISLNKFKEPFREAKKERSEKIIKARHERIDILKKHLDIPEDEHPSLEALEKIYKSVTKK